MNYSKLLIVALGLTVLTAVGCDRGDKSSDSESPSSSIETRFTISEIVPHIESSKPVITAVITNTSTPIHGLSAIVSVIKNDTIIDTATANLTTTTLQENQSTVLNATFNIIHSHSQYDSRRITYTWQEEHTESSQHSLSASSHSVRQTHTEEF